MAGTRLLTQVSFILGVLILLVPPSLYVHHVHRAAFPTTLPFSNTTTFYHPTINIQVYIATTTATPLDWDQIRSATQDVKGLVAFPGEQPLSAPPDHVDEVSLEGWLKSLSPSFNVPSSPATYTLVLLPANRQAPLPKLTIGTSRIAWLSPSDPPSTTSSLLVAAAIKALAQDYLLTPPPGPPPELDYHLRFTLLNEQPDVHYCTWDFSRLQRLLHQEVRRLSVVTKLVMSSDMASYQTIIDDGDMVTRRGQPGYTYIPRSSMMALPSRLVLHPSMTFRESRHVEMITSCPPPTRGHLSFYDDLDTGKVPEGVTCQIDSWGAITLLDTTTTVATTGAAAIPSLHPLTPSDYGRTGGGALGVFRSLLGLNQTIDHEEVGAWGFPGEVVVLPPSCDESITDWELDRVIIYTTQSRARRAVELLHALLALLGRRPDMPFDDSIAERGLLGIGVLHDLLDSKGDHFIGACQQATRALRLVQEAYFDPKLVPTPVFPLEHVLAIYMPLIAPLLVPLIGGLLKEVKRYKDKKRSNKGKDNQEEGEAAGGGSTGTNTSHS